MSILLACPQIYRKKQITTDQFSIGHLTTLYLVCPLMTSICTLHIRQCHRQKVRLISFLFYEFDDWYLRFISETASRNTIR